MTIASTVSLHAEAVQVARQTRDTGSVSVSIATEVRDHPIDETLTSTRVEVRRVPVDRIVDQPPPSRQEGDTLIIPVVEEVVVTRFLVREEIHVTRTTTTRRHQDVVALRTERALVTRSGDDGGPSRSNVQPEPEEQDNAQ